MKQGMVSFVKTKEAAVACVLGICAQMITMVMSCVYSATTSLAKDQYASIVLMTQQASIVLNTQ